MRNLHPKFWGIRSYFFAISPKSRTIFPNYVLSSDHIFQSQHRMHFPPVYYFLMKESVRVDRIWSIIIKILTLSCRLEKCLLTWMPWRKYVCSALRGFLFAFMRSWPRYGGICSGGGEKVSFWPNIFHFGRLDALWLWIVAVLPANWSVPRFTGKSKSTAHDF